MPLEELPEEGEISISDGITDLLHAAMVVFQHSLGGSHSKFLQVDQRSVSSGLLKATHEIAVKTKNVAPVNWL